jgi:YidC/Oxa1 family membrane protein insertase
MPQDNSRNTFIFIACALVIFMAYEFFVLQPQARRKQEEARAAAAAQQRGAAQAGKLSATGQPPAVQISRAQAAAATPRVPIDTPSLQGSISLKGARVDDLFLKRYRETLDDRSPMVELFRPDGTLKAYFAEFGWQGANLPGLPDANTVWTAPAGARLTPATPLTLTYRSPQGLEFTRVVTVDDNYMFSITDTVANRGAGQVTIAPYATVQRQGLPANRTNNGIIHEGAIGVLDDGKLRLSKYSSWKKKGQFAYNARGGWLGVTDKYWLAAVIPEPSAPISATYRVTPVAGVDIYDTSFLGGYVNIAPGKQTVTTTRLFAGAKTLSVLNGYEKALGIADFDKAIDWGMFWFLTRPIFQVLEFFYHLVGNFGIAILLLTVLVKILFFYPANKSYESITKMKKVQPELDQIRKRHAKDAAKQQQEMMALYQREKINPFMGCLPVLIQIPVFYALYKTLSVTIEMRHAPFFGWIQDLSAKDPTTIWNLFGLLPYDPSTVPLLGHIFEQYAHIGIWPLIMGFTMYVSQLMTPTTGMDKTQAKIMQLFPLIFTFTLSGFAAGLVIYWSWNNLLSILQQYVIMRRFKVDNPIDGFIRRVRGKRAPAAAS